MTYSTFLEYCKQRMEFGKPKYGDFNPDTDQRDLLKETLDELADAENYLQMTALKLKPGVSSLTLDRLVHLHQLIQYAVNTLSDLQSQPVATGTGLALDRSGDTPSQPTPGRE